MHQAYNALRVGKLFRYVVLDSLLICQVALVSDQETVNTLDSVSLNLAEPSLDICEGVLSSIH